MTKTKNINGGSYLRRLREEAGMTQAVLASHLGVTKVTISAYENGDRNITLKRMHQLSKLFSVDLANFIQFDPEVQNLELALRSTGLSNIGIQKVSEYIVDLKKAGYREEAINGRGIVVGYNFKNTSNDQD